MPKLATILATMQSHRYTLNGVTNERVGYNGPNMMRRLREKQFEVRVYFCTIDKLWTVETWRKEANSYGIGLDCWIDFEDEDKARTYFEETVASVHAYMDAKYPTKRGSPAMKLATIFAAAAIALTLSTAVAAEYDGPRLKLRGDDTAIQLRDGRLLQTEYVVFHALNHNRDGYVIFEDGSPGIIDDNGCSITNPAGERFALRDC